MSDMQIDSSDSFFSSLQLWRDDNHDGVSQVDELVSLSSSGVRTIYVDHRERRRTDGRGNSYRYEGDALISRNGSVKLHRIFDVFLSIAPAN